MLALAIAGGLAQPAAAQDDPGRVVVAVLPYGTTVEQIASVPELAPGLVSAGLGPVPVAQTFLDVSQGNRVNEDLYDGELPRLYVRDGVVPRPLWERTLARADSAPANIVPGLLATQLARAGVPVVAEADMGLATLIGVNGEGAVAVRSPPACAAGCGPGLSVQRVAVEDLESLAGALGPDDLLIALAAGARAQQQLLPAGVAGPGYSGTLTSSSTRTDGVVLSTDIAPTVLEHLGVEVPDEMNGSEIVAEGERDPQAVADLQDRLDERPSRNTAVVLPLAIWLALAGLAALIWRAPGARVALRLLALAVAWTPALLLVLAAPGAGPAASAITVALGAPLLAIGSDRLLAAPASLAVACAVTVGAYAIDVIAGSPLTALSILGPNPGAGVRFFGIGNELEAILTTLTLIGAGAWLDWRRDRGPLDRRAAAAWFAGIGLLAIAAFAPGRFGADVGAAIVLGVGTATAAVIALAMERRRAVLVVAGGGAAALVALLLADLVLGGAHLSRSVLGAGEAGDVLDVFDRRLTLMANTFIHPVYPELLAICAVLLVAGAVWRRRVRGWFGDRWAALAGWAGALAGIAVGTVANDSGSVLLVLGTICLAVTAGYWWATGPPARRSDFNTS